MTDQATYWHEQIHRIMPELDIKDYQLHQEGLVNDVLIVNNTWVIRFTKTEWGKELMDLEACLMDFLQPQVSLSIPCPVKRGDGILVYSHINGTPFLRDTWIGATEEKRQYFAHQLGQFLRELHGAQTKDLDWEIPHTLAPVTRETWLDIYARFVDKVYPLLLPNQIDWVENLFEPALSEPDFFDFQEVLIHGDLTPQHILFSSEDEDLNAVIDFGMAGLGDPATDFGGLINAYGESLIAMLEDEYPDIQKIIKRARFYAQTTELHWVLLGVESGEYYWFTAHLGGARDIR